MRDFYRTYEDHPNLLSLALQIGWIQNVMIMEAELTMDLRGWYMKTALQFGWSKAELTTNIEENTYERLEIIVEKPDDCHENNGNECINLMLVAFKINIRGTDSRNRMLNRNYFRRRWYYLRVV